MTVVVVVATVVEVVLLLLLLLCAVGRRCRCAPDQRDGGVEAVRRDGGEHEGDKRVLVLSNGQPAGVSFGE